MPFNGEYPAVPGNKPVSILDLSGPASYVVITPATPPTGGQAVTASQFGLQVIEAIWAAAGSDDGTYKVIPYFNPFQNNLPSAAVVLQWITAATGAEVAATTNLSARKVRLMAIGR